MRFLFLAVMAVLTVSAVTVTAPVAADDINKKAAELAPPSGPGTGTLPVPVADHNAAPEVEIPPFTTLDGELPLGEFPMLRLTPDKIEVVTLDHNATNVLVGNNKHLMAVMETPRQILLIPRKPGATHLQVLDASGKTIYQRSVIIAAPKEHYVRVRRTCATKDKGACAEYSVFFCPDMCHAVSVTGENQAGASAAVPAETASSGTVPANSASRDTSGLESGSPVDGASAPADMGNVTGNALMVP